MDQIVFYGSCAPTDDQMRLLVLREAASVGIADIEAGRFITFDSDDEINQYLAELTLPMIKDDRGASTVA
jgi:hypothetical protein